jgi:hypothetical protein
MSLETVYAPSVSLPNAADVENDGSVQLAPETDSGGLTEGLAVGPVGSALGWLGPADGDVPGDEADGAEAEADGEAPDGDVPCDGDDADDADWPTVGPAWVAEAPAVATAPAIPAAARLALEAACLGT